MVDEGIHSPGQAFFPCFGVAHWWRAGAAFASVASSADPPKYFAPHLQLRLRDVVSMRYFYLLLGENGQKGQNAD
jgi:hypothetical protein